jgi:hypothetical protein
MTLSTIITWLMGLIGMLRGRSSPRVQLEIRSEAAIKAERKQLYNLHARMVEIDNEIRETIHEIVEAKAAGNTALESDLNTQRDQLFEKFREAKRQYDDLKGRSD